jgi:hypothetical protein
MGGKFVGVFHSVSGKYWNPIVHSGHSFSSACKRIRRCEPLALATVIL